MPGSHRPLPWEGGWVRVCTVIIQPVFNKRLTCVRLGAQSSSPEARPAREQRERGGDIRSHGPWHGLADPGLTWPGLREARGGSGPRAAAAAGLGSRGLRVSADFPLGHSGHPQMPLSPAPGRFTWVAQAGMHVATAPATGQSPGPGLAWAGSRIPALCSRR